ncbi:hypothetical protein SAMN05216420_12219 [Nitrosospira sp. Nl5]|nr:hypothetical protein SAMN05216420_12219 [Nitrosospira sp. Nl5]
MRWLASALSHYINGIKMCVNVECPPTRFSEARDE